MQKLHNFMDKMREKPVEERRRILFASTALFGTVIGIFGLWNMSRNLLALGGNQARLAASADSQTASSFSSLGDNMAGVWSSIQGGLQDLNDKIGRTEAEYYDELTEYEDYSDVLPIAEEQE